MKVNLKVSNKMADGVFITLELGLEESLPNGVTKEQYYNKAVKFLSKQIDTQFKSME